MFRAVPRNRPRLRPSTYFSNSLFTSTLQHPILETVRVMTVSKNKLMYQNMPRYLPANEHAVAYLVEALFYKPDCLGFDSR
jgi:hypothetical protein